MKYISTRDNHPPITAAQAIKLGMVPSGGLFVPETLPHLSPAELAGLSGKSYQELAQAIMTPFLEGYEAEEIQFSVQSAYHSKNFFHQDMAPLHQLDERTFILELWHGPTAAFKDMALQIMPYLLSQALAKDPSPRETVILVATSGDTGKAALEGFKDVPGIKIIVFFPYQGVSKVQEMQMTTTEGHNTHVVAVKGNFDDCQDAVKAIFGDGRFKERLAEKGYELSSANSINWGRLLPQIVYYFSSYLALVKQGAVPQGHPVNFVVPTGNFGNILAAWYAKSMGLPIGKIICASNDNKVLTDFFHSGVYNRKRDFVQTNSPSMDILISSNLERFLFEMLNHQGQQVKTWMEELSGQGQFTVTPQIKSQIDKILWAGFATETETLETIKTVFEQKGYTLDTHTAVGMRVYRKYVEESGDTTLTVIDATASPFKFSESVLEALEGKGRLEARNEIEALNVLSKLSGQPIHPGLQDLEQKPIRHRRVCEKTEIRQQIEDILKLV